MGVQRLTPEKALNNYYRDGGHNAWRESMLMCMAIIANSVEIIAESHETVNKELDFLRSAILKDIERR
tara:strand:- start:568 stop:771 length:204 start_codon:yes stop_codon:yes gene_type:complete